MATLARKLGIAPGQRVCLLDAPATSAALLRAELPSAVAITIAETLGTVSERYDAIIFWPATLDGLAERFAELQRRIVPDGAVWAVIPKKKHATRRGIAFTWEQMQAAGLETDLVDNKIATVSEEEYATRFVIRKDRRARHALRR